jgi:hypothetical protein
MEDSVIEVAMLGLVCFVVGGLAGAVVTLVMAAIIAGSRADDEMDALRNRRKE